MIASTKSQNLLLFVVTTAAAASIHLSIAISQSLLGAGILLYVILRQKLYFPRIWIPLSSFFLWTALADVLSPDPWGGRAQVKKFFVFFLIPLIFGVFREQFNKAFWLVAAWALVATASGSLGLVQFVSKYRHAKLTGEDFYVTYVGHRITGFESHWMTFGALQLSVLSLLVAQLWFARRRMPAWIYAICLPILLAAIVLGETRSIWIATAAVSSYLVWSWRPRMLLALPVLVMAAYFVSPKATQERFQSLVAPHGETDSNRHRVVTFRTGLEMVKAHPWFGIGPEQIRRQFDSYLPADIKRPLPVGYYGHLHNIYVQYAAERGVPGLLLLLWMIGLTVWDCVRGVRLAGRARSDVRFLLHGTIAVIIGVLVGGCFEYNLGDSEVLMMFASVIGLAYAALYQITGRGEAFPHVPTESQSAVNPALDAPQPLSLG